MKALFMLILFITISVGLFAQTGLQVQHITGVDIPNLQYDLVVGKPDSLLHFYKAYANADSVWVSTFTCNPQGVFSNQTVLHAYPYHSAVNDTLTMIRTEYRYNKVYSHFRINSTLIIMTVDDADNAVDHVINTNGNQFNYAADYGIPYCLFDENNIFTIKLYQNKIYRINLLTDEFTTFYENSAYCHFSLYALSDDFLIALNPLYPWGNLLIDTQFTIHQMQGEFNSAYVVRSTVANMYYPTEVISYAFSSSYVFLFVEQDSIRMNIVDDDSIDHVLENDDSIVQLSDNRYICITKLTADTGELLQSWFGRYCVVDGIRTLDLEFPDLSSLANPRTITRINDESIIALSGEAGTPMVFTVIDLAHQQLSSNSISIDSNPIGWNIYPAGNNFYMLKDNRIHTFRIEESQSMDDNIAPDADIHLTCFPNPFNPSTTISYTIPKEVKVALKIYNIKGQLVNTLFNGNQTKGEHKLVWNGEDNSGNTCASGVYFYRLTAQDKTVTKKMLMLK